MSTRAHRRAAFALGALAMLMVPAAIVVGVLVGAAAPDRPHDPRPAVSRVDGVPNDGRAARTEADPGVNLDPLTAHQTMLEQMRVNVTPQMLQTMNASPLTHSASDLAELERHAADIDRMLARNP